MNWFRGEITEAIAKSKSRGAIFVVYVEGVGEKSTHFSQILNEPVVYNILNEDSFENVKIEENSVTFQQFGQIYPNIAVPSLYFIGKTGAPLDIVTDISNGDALKEKILKVLEKAGIKNIKTVQASTSFQSDGATSKTETANQKMPKIEEDEHKDKEVRQWQDEKKIKQLLENRQKEETQSKLERQRILDQIAQDKAERLAKYSNIQTEKTSTTVSHQQKSDADVNMCRLQFRLPNGKTYNQEFYSSETLGAIHAYVKSNINHGLGGFILSTTFPRHEFTEDEYPRTLVDLGLTPSSVLLILPLSRGVVSTDMKYNVVNMIWYIFGPFITALNYLKSFFGGTQNAANSDSTRNTVNKDNTDVKRNTKIRQSGETTVIRRRGNVHQLSNKTDSDDENNTWNGNSTQQM